VSGFPSPLCRPPTAAAPRGPCMHQPASQIPKRVAKSSASVAAQRQPVQLMAADGRVRAAADGSLFDPREVEPDNIRDPDARSVREALDAVTTKH
jgi:hypothetical protein